MRIATHGKRKIMINGSRSQSSMEYLMTYGWAILITAVVLGAFYSLGIFNGINPKGNSCLPFPGFQCAGITLNAAGALTFTLGYIGQSALNITAIGCSNSTIAPSSSWSWAAVNVSPLRSAQSERVIAACNLNGRSTVGAPFSGTLWVQYYNGGGSTSVQEVGSVSGTSTSMPSYSTSVKGTVSARGNDPRGVAYDPSNGYMYVANQDSGAVNVISGTSVVASITGLSNPAGIAYNPGNGYMYVTSYGGGTAVNVISGTSVIATIPVGSYSEGVAYDPGNGDMYVANWGSGTVNVISGTSVVGTINGLSHPFQIAYNPSNGYMYVTDYTGSAVTMISGTAVVGSPITVGTEPLGIAYNPSNGYMYVSNNGGGTGTTVSVISGNTIIGSPITVGTGPSEIAYNPSNGYMYVTDQLGGGAVSIISGTTVIATVTGPPQPIGIAYDPSNGYMYVTNWGSGVVNEI